MSEKILTPDEVKSVHEEDIKKRFPNAKTEVFGPYLELVNKKGGKTILSLSDSGLYARFYNERIELSKDLIILLLGVFISLFFVVLFDVINELPHYAHTNVVILLSTFVISVILSFKYLTFHRELNKRLTEIADRNR